MEIGRGKKTGQVISDQLVDQEIIKKLTEAEAGEVFPMKWDEMSVYTKHTKAIVSEISLPSG